MKKAVIYARVSSGRQEKEGFSIPAQIEFLTEYARHNGFSVVEQFIEAETAKIAGRKQFNNMLKYITENQIDAILAEKTDRIYRNFKDYIVLEDFKHIEVHLVKENMIISEHASSHVKFMHGIKVLMAKNYIDNLSEEVIKGKNRKAKEGYYPQQAPVGYKNDSDKTSSKRIIVPDEKAAFFIRRLFDLYATGSYSVKELRKKIFEEGFNHKGKPYARSRILAILHDPFYIGKFIYNGVIYEGKHEPIVSVDKYNAVQKLFNHSRARTHDVEFAYTGLLTCGYCGCQLTAELKKGKYIYYHCTGRRGGDCKKHYIREEKIDEVMLDLIGRIPAPTSDIMELIKQSLKDSRKLRIDYEENSTEAIQKQIDTLNKRLDNLYTDKMDQVITEEYWKEKHNLWYNEKEELIEKLKSFNNAARTFDEGANLLLNFCETLPQEYLKASPKKKQQILRLIGSNFIYKDKKLSVELSSVFNLLINNQNLVNGGNDCPMLEPPQIIYRLKKLLSQEFITQLKSLKIAA